jgi:hypothetical protein
MILSNDEFFIIMGIVVLNMKNYSNVVTPFKEYNRVVHIHKITLSEEIIDEILEICNKHTYNKNGITFKVINKLRKTKELIEADKEHEKKISKINDKWSDLIYKINT